MNKKIDIEFIDGYLLRKMNYSLNEKNKIYLLYSNY